MLYTYLCMLCAMILSTSASATISTDKDDETSSLSWCAPTERKSELAAELEELPNEGEPVVRQTPAHTVPRGHSYAHALASGHSRQQNGDTYIHGICFDVMILTTSKANNFAGNYYAECHTWNRVGHKMPPQIVDSLPIFEDALGRVSYIDTSLISDWTVSTAQLALLNTGANQILEGFNIPHSL